MKKGQNIVAASAAMLAAEPILALAHTGGAGVLAGLAAGAVAYLVTDEVHEARQGRDPLATSAAKSAPIVKKARKPGQPSLAYRLINGKSVRSDAQPGGAGTSGLPRRSPTFGQMAHLIKPDHDILGFDGTRFITAESLKQSVNIALIGIPHSGKTTCLTFHVAQAVMRGAIVRGWDLHGDVAADLGSLFNIMEDVKDILEDCKWLQKERDRRLALRRLAKSGNRTAQREWNETREIFYVVDELNALMLRVKNHKAARDLVTDTLLSLISEGRKFKMRSVLAGQTMPATLFGDNGTGTRDIISTKYAFRSEDQQARMLGIDQKAIEALLPLLAGKEAAGYAILAGGPLLHPILISIPLTTVEDIRTLIDEFENESTDEDDDLLQQGGDAQDEDTDYAEGEALPAGVTDFALDLIVGAYKAGWHLPDIAALVQMDPPTFKAACTLVGIDTRSAPHPVPTRAAPSLKVVQKPRRAELSDAIEVWNERGGGIGRPSLQKGLRARGLECSDYLAGDLLAQIAERIEAVDGGGVAVGEE